MLLIIGNILVAALLLGYTYQDIRSGRVFIPAALLLGAAGLILHAACRMPALECLTGMLPGMVLLMISRLCGGAVGSGDAITLICCGTVLGFSRTFEMLFLALVFAAAWSVLLLMRKQGMKKTFAFMPFLLASHICIMVR